MQWFNFSQHRLGIILGVLFLGFYSVGLADDIEIDLGTTPTPVSQAKPTSVDSQKSHLARVASTSKSDVEAINVSKIDDGTLVLITGQNIKKPSVSKLSDAKLKIVFPGTSLSVAPRLDVNGPMVKTIRSAAHGTAAWVLS